MSTAIAIAQLSSLVRDLESWIAGLNDIPFAKDDLRALDVLGMKLSDAAATVQTKTGSFRPSREDEAWKASRKLRSQAQSTIAHLIDHGKLERPAVFRRNIVLIFTGPKVSEFDSDEVRSRKAATRLRCERLKTLSPDGVVAWAASYTPTSWAAGLMGKDIFECLIDSIELGSTQNWPPVIRDTLQKLRTDEALQNSLQYSEFMVATSNPSTGSQARLENQIHTSTPSSEPHIGTWNPKAAGSSHSPYKEQLDNGMAQEQGNLIFMPVLYLPREFYKYSGLLTSQLEYICGPHLSNAIKTSCLWDGGVATHCFGVAFPSNPLEDAIVVISMSQLAGSQLVQFIDSTPPTSSLPGLRIQQ
ncbi:hypothetical protein VC83_06151 [Pseudogymnoascus destructans]|uniref:Uncharacterized protein n=2 Tax=Pseudogymnoascus destructans TaxID=655981 RepID=L8G251_PSED2|nr:uncharacterized protein VC83_06151 [Pseudogymnoascus destructans]ELR07345.1 hypothetical protein GMDG_02525 [Pseudogymnoascus destructans 20631-21]OAF58883.1 hypothetical protein VC83_06151 [Pseudogymnoascus destructans]